MRILSRKIWRAFPELDQYDDKTCKEYVNSAHAMRGRLWRIMAIVGAVVLGFFLAIGISPSVNQLLRYLAEWVFEDIQFDGLIGGIVLILPMTNIIWMPWLIGAITRDYLLERCLKRKLAKAGCPKCRYNLLGLEIIQHEQQKAVQCPECGSYTTLNIGHITEADINPTLLAKT